MTADGAARRIRATMSATARAPWTVPVGLFGLLKKTRPAPRDDAAATIPSMSSRIDPSTRTSLVTGLPTFENCAAFARKLALPVVVVPHRPVHAHRDARQGWLCRQR